MNKLYHILSLQLIILQFPITATAQRMEKSNSEQWTLEQCINHAIEHNIMLKEKNLVLEEHGIGVSESRWAFAPSLSASGGYSLSTVSLVTKS